jgi:hypothetical protein
MREMQNDSFFRGQTQVSFCIAGPPLRCYVWRLKILKFVSPTFSREKRIFFYALPSYYLRMLVMLMKLHSFGVRLRRTRSRFSRVAPWSRWATACDVTPGGRLAKNSTITTSSPDCCPTRTCSRPCRRAWPRRHIDVSARAPSAIVYARPVTCRS